MTMEILKSQILEEKIKTPSYIFDLDCLSEHVNQIKKITQGKTEICYAMKANPFLIECLATKIDKIEVCSPGELEICKKRKINPDQIVFSGVNKTKENIKAALEYGVTIITLESLKHWKLLKELCTEKKYETVKILPRLTSGAQFGMSEEEMFSIIKEAMRLPQFRVMGVHYFTGTQKKKLERLLEELEKLNTLMEKIKNETGLNNLTLEYGAGLAVPYFEGEDFDSLYQHLSAVVEKIESIQKTAACQYKTVLELGRFLSFQCGTYLTKVDDIKKNGERYCIIVDGGIHQLNYYGQNMAMRVPKMELIHTRNGSNQMNTTMTIYGSLCTFADVLVRTWEGPLPIEGDVFCFKNTGSYSVTEAPALFLSRTLPTIYLYTEKNGCRIARPFLESYKWNTEYNDVFQRE